jgi:hypothetical protein
MRASNSARPLQSPFPPGGIAHPLEREDVTLSLVELEPLEDDFSLEELSIIEGQDDVVLASCPRLSQICPAKHDDEELEIDEDTGWAHDFWVDVSELNTSSVAEPCNNPFLVEEPSTFAPAGLAVQYAIEDLSEWLEPLEEGQPESLAADMLDPPTEDIDWLLGEEPSMTLDLPMLDPPTVDIDELLEEELDAGTPGDGRATAQRRTIAPRRARRRSMPEEKTLVLRRSWICMPPGNTNADPTGLSVAHLLQIVRGRSGESRPPESRSPMPSLPRFPLLPPDPRTNPVHVPALRLPRFDVE